MWPLKIIKGGIVIPVMPIQLICKTYSLELLTVLKLVALFYNITILVLYI